MPNPHRIFDHAALTQQRARAMRQGAELFLHEEAAGELHERLCDVNRAFKSPAIVTGFPEFWQRKFPKALVVPDDETLALSAHSHDLVIHALALHRANDPVGQLIQSRHALQADGLMIAVFFGGDTLSELRTALGAAETSLTGGLSPRVIPMGDLRDYGALLQRAGLALPVADSVRHCVEYASPLKLLRDIRAMGEANAMSNRRKLFAQRRLFVQMSDIYRRDFSTTAGRVRATFDMIYLTGWAPDACQPKPLKPGSAQVSLADVLDTSRSAPRTGTTSNTPK